MLKPLAALTFAVSQQSALIHLFKVMPSLNGDMPKYVMERFASNSAAC